MTEQEHNTASDSLEAKCRALISDWEANGGSRPLGDPSAETWHQAARQLRDALGNVLPPDRRSKAHSLNDCWCGMPHRREDFL